MSNYIDYAESKGFRVASIGGGRGLYTCHLIDVGRRIGDDTGKNGEYLGYEFEASTKEELDTIVRNWVDSQPPLHWVHEPPEKIFGLWYQWGIDGQQHVIKGES